MKAFWIGAAIAALSGPVVAQSVYQPYRPVPIQPYGAYGNGSNPSSHPVQGYMAQQGTFVPPHMQTNPNATQMDNYGTQGNVNPFTGAIGTRTPRY